MGNGKETERERFILVRKLVDISLIFLFLKNKKKSVAILVLKNYMSI
jgi:hypothetical protein